MSGSRTRASKEARLDTVIQRWRQGSHAKAPTVDGVLLAGYSYWFFISSTNSCAICDIRLRPSSAVITCPVLTPMSTEIVP